MARGRLGKGVGGAGEPGSQELGYDGRHPNVKRAHCAAGAFPGEMAA